MDSQVKQAQPLPLPGTGAEVRYREERTAHWDEVARLGDRRQGLGGAYHRRLERVYRFLVPPGQRVLELGCGTGDLLAALEPAVGVGVDVSGEMIRRAGERHPSLRFLTADAAETGGLAETFDVVILSDLINDVWDVQRLFDRILPLTTRHTRIVLNFYSRLWGMPLAIAQRLRLTRPVLYQNWLTVEDVENLLELAGLRPVRHWPEVLLPLPIPLLAPFCNRFLVRLWPFKYLALSNFVVARPAPQALAEEPLVSVIVPARNEEGNVPGIFARTPEMGRGTELIFVEGHSTDDTYGAIERAIAAHPERRARLFRQEGKGKGDAVRLGFAAAAGDVLMILDADLTVPPEDLPRFYAVIRSGQGEFVNGVRLVYPMEKQAMRFANLLGNKLFSLAFSWLLGQPIKDTLCGTKVLRKPDYEKLAANRSYFGDFDPFGDFDLLFGAAKLGLEIVEVPVRYRERTYGTTNIQRWRHGWLLLKMCLFAAGRIKFV
ncbi:MAG TPA: bifunctional class I SAM-dependent methyltransferase/glycosyltransferase family 2 protein [Thermoanaerobaculia bacterium]|nr:bifunctional class I SAM-dependent methyltransferase/glycosyltransferase family 2 protein [Thermoanaerobaculia bacterium]